MFKRKIFRLDLPTRTLALGKRTLLDGRPQHHPGQFFRRRQIPDCRPQAIRHALTLKKSGADILDIGAESTRPGSKETSAVEEFRRLLPVLQSLRGKLKIPISIDTRKASVAEIALSAGAEIVNDVSGLHYDPRLAEVAARRRVRLILTHMRGEPATMQKIPFARNVNARRHQGTARASIQKARNAGVAKSQIISTPASASAKASSRITSSCKACRNWRS